MRTQLRPDRTILREGRVVEDAWIHLNDDDPLPSRGDVVVSLGRLARERDVLLARDGRLGARLETHERAEELAAAVELDALALVVIHVHKFVDGRYYSTARLLRMRHGFTGELRATGDVLPDQLFYMRRVGFDAFSLRPDKSIETALRALRTFTVTYQGAEDGPPLYRRRFADVRDPAA